MATRDRRTPRTEKGDIVKATAFTAHRHRLVLLLALLIGVGLALVPAARAAEPVLPGDLIWRATLSFSGVYDDDGSVAVQLDPWGNAIVAGNAYTAPGQLNIEWHSYARPTSVGVSPHWRWGSYWNGSANGRDTAVGLVVNGAGESYIAGTTASSGHGSDYVLLRISAAGVLDWARVYDGPVHKADEASAVALDGAGNIYVTGASIGKKGNRDIVTLKYTPAGALLWVKRFNSPWNSCDRGGAVTVRGGSVYVAGVSRHPGHGDDITLIKYTTAGVRRWVRFYDDSLHRSEMVSRIAAAPGVVCVAGEGKFGPILSGDALLIKYTSGGARKWTKYLGGSGGLDDAWSDVAVDAAGRVHVTGFAYGKTTGDNAVTAVYSAGGALRWKRAFSSPGNHLDIGEALALDAAGTTYVAASSENNSNKVDVVALAYDAAGGRLWATRFDGVAHGDDYAADVVVDSSDYVWVVGQSETTHRLDMLTTLFAK